MAIPISYACLDCGNEIESFKRDAPPCPKCESENMHRVWNGGGSFNYKHPIHSDALAVHPDQRAEHEKNCPNIRLDKQNRPVFDNFVDHEDYMKKINVVKVPQKIRNRGKQIA